MELLDTAVVGVAKVSLPFEPIEMRGEALFFAIDVSPDPKILGKEQAWRVFRRYTDFSELCSRLGSTAPFPPKLWMLMTHDRLEARRAQLEQWLQLTINSCVFDWVAPLRDFLDICLRVPRTLRPGDEHIVIARLKDQNEDVRKAAVEALTTLTDANMFRPSESAVEDVITLFEHSDERVRVSAIGALAGMVKPGSERPIEALTNCLTDVKEDVRMEAVAALAKISLPGDPSVLTAIIACVEDEAWYVRGIAIDTLAQLAQPFDGRIVGVIIGRLEDAHWAVRRAALQNLGKRVQRGDRSTIEAVASLVRDSVLEVRKAAMETLQTVACVDDTRAITSVAVCLQDEDEALRNGAVHALVRMASPDNEHAIVALANTLGHQESNIRMDAMNAISMLSQPGNGHAIRAIALHIEDPDSNLRRAAMHALANMATPGNQIMLDALCSFLEGQVAKMNSGEHQFDVIIDRLATGSRMGIKVSHGDGATLQIESINEGGVVANWNRSNPQRPVHVGDHIIAVNGVAGNAKSMLDQLTRARHSFVTVARINQWLDEKQNALRILAQISPKGNTRAIDAMMPFRKDADWRVRTASVESLAETSFLEDCSIVETLAGCFEDDVIDVRKSVAGALTKLSRSGTLWGAVSSHVSIEDKWEVTAVAEAIKQVVQAGDEHAIMALATRLKHPSVCVRKAAMESLSAVALPGQDHAINVVVELLSHSEAFVRSSAVEVLVKVVRAEDKRALGALAALLEDKEANVRQAVLKVLPILKQNGIVCDVNVVASCLKDQDVIVRQAAAVALGQLAERGNPSAIAAVVGRLDHRIKRIPQSDVPLMAFVQGALVGVRCIYVDLTSGASTVATYKLDRTITNFSIAVNQQVFKWRLDQINTCQRLGSFLQSLDNQQGAGVHALQHLVEADRDRALLIEFHGSGASSQQACLLESSQAAADVFTACVETLKSYEAADENASVRRAAVDALTLIAEDDAEYAINILMECLEDEDPSVREGGIEALGKTVQLGQKRVLTAVVDRLDDAETVVKHAAVQTLAKLSPPGCEDTVAVLAAFLEKEAASLRQNQFDVILDSSFAKKVGITIQPESGRELLEIVEILEDGALASWNRTNPLRRVHAGDHIMEVNGVRGDVTKLIAQLKSPQRNLVTIARSAKADGLISGLRQTALHVLAKVAFKGNAQAVGAVQAHLKDQDVDVKKAAAEALQMLTRPVDPGDDDSVDVKQDASPYCAKPG